MITTRFDKNALVLFDQSNGTKVRLAIGKYEKAGRPELVDIKITDWCDVGCVFCYQNSTIDGLHAPMENMEVIAFQLGKEKVFEISIGGGEATQHPKFVDIVKMFRQYNVVPSFTTKKPVMVRKLWDDIHDSIGGFAYSAETAEQIFSSAKIMRDIPSDRIGLHYVMGLGNKEHFENYLKAAHDVGYRVTLLGYKTSGRGKNLSPYNYDWWIDSVGDLISKNVCPSLSIDTPLAGQYEDLLPLPSFMFHTEEGKFSMYIDAVSMKMGASSFDRLDELVPFDQKWKERYKKI